MLRTRRGGTKLQVLFLIRVRRNPRGGEGEKTEQQNHEKPGERKPVLPKAEPRVFPERGPPLSFERNGGCDFGLDLRSKHTQKS
jgi:hypothetical protein